MECICVLCTDFCSWVFEEIFATYDSSCWKADIWYLWLLFVVFLAFRRWSRGPVFDWCWHWCLFHFVFWDWNRPRFDWSSHALSSFHFFYELFSIHLSNLFWAWKVTWDWISFFCECFLLCVWGLFYVVWMLLMWVSFRVFGRRLTLSSSWWPASFSAWCVLVGP